MMFSLYHQANKPIDFQYKRGLNYRFIIQQQEILSVEIT